MCLAVCSRVCVLRKPGHSCCTFTPCRLLIVSFVVSLKYFSFLSFFFACIFSKIGGRFGGIIGFLSVPDIPFFGKYFSVMGSFEHALRMLWASNLLVMWLALLNRVNYVLALRLPLVDTAQAGCFGLSSQTCVASDLLFWNLGRAIRESSQKKTEWRLKLCFCD